MKVGRYSCIIIALALTACNIDHGLGLLPWIEGKVIFEGEMPPNTDQVIIVVAPQFPPTEWTDLIRTPPLPLGQDTVRYEVPLPYGTYEVIAAIWKAKGQTWSIQSISNILGFYTIPNKFEPASVTLTEEHPVARNIDIIADYDLIKRGAYISGRITYQGDWPEDTGMMILAAFPKVPESLMDYLLATGIDLTLSTFVPYQDYCLAVKSGIQKCLTLYWQRKGGSVSDFKKLASYEFPGFGKNVAEGDTLKNIDIVADFNKLGL